MGKKGDKPKQRVTTYFMSIHYGICAGPIDKLLRIFYGEKEAWEGPVAGVSAVVIDNPELNGGVKKEGGLRGIMHVLPGASDQETPDELATRLDLTVDTCPGFRGLASLLFHGAPGSGHDGFYWTANSPYLRGVWAEVQHIEGHANAYAWYPAKAAIPRPAGDAAEDAPESFTAITGATGNRAYKWDTFGDFIVRGEVLDAPATHFQIWKLPDGTLTEVANPNGGANGIHITKSGDIVVRDFSPGSFHIYSAASGAKIQTIAVEIDLDLNFATYLDDVAVSAFWGLLGLVHILAWTGNGLGTFQWVLLQRAGFSWSKVASPAATASSVASLSLGPTYAYCMIGDLQTILRVSWDSEGSITETEVSPPGLTANIAACHYDDETGTVVIACVNGDLFVYSEDLDTLVTARTGNDFTLARDGLLSKRMKSGPGRIAFRSAANPHDIHEFALPGLAPLRTVDVSATSLPSAEVAHSFQAYNEKWFGAFLPRHFGASTFWFLGGGDRYDMNPAHIILECLTNTEWGMGAPTTSIDLDAFTAAADTLYSEGFGLSLMWAQQSTIETFVREILDHIEGTLYVNPATGLITLKLIRGDYDAATLDTLDADNCRVIEYQRKSWGDTVNEIVVSWTNPENEQSETIARQDLGNIAVQGGIVSDSRNYYGVRYHTLAAKLADRDLRVASYPLATAQVEADRSAWQLVPGGVVKLSYPEYGIGLLIMRIASIDYGRPGESRIRIGLVEDVFALPLAEFVTPPQRQWEDPREDPAPAAHALALTLPYMLAIATRVPGADADYPEVVAAVFAAQSGGDTKEFELVGIVTDAAGNQTVTQLGTRTILARATLASALSAEASSALTLAGLSGLTQGEGPAAGGMAMIGEGEEADNELVLITQVVSGIYTLQRGALDTVPRAWPAGSAIWFFSARASVHDPEIRAAFETVRYKVLPRTSKGLLPEASAPILSATLTERPHLPTRPANVTVAGVGFGAVDLTGASPPITSFTVAWAQRNRLTEDSQPLAWSAGSVTPEDGQTTRIDILDSTTRDILATFGGLTGTSYEVPISAFQGLASPVLVTAIVRVTAERGPNSPPYESLQGHEIAIAVDPGPDALTIDGDPVLSGAVGIAYDGFTVTAAGGLPPYAFALVGDWPAGLSIAAGPGADQATISGTPTEAGLFPDLSVRVTDALGNTADLALGSPPLEITQEDTTAPTLTNPSGEGSGATTADLSVTTDEDNGTLYWVVTQSETAPNKAQVKGGVDENSDDADAAGSQSVSATGAQSASVDSSPGLTPSTGSPASPVYYVHFMHEDDAGNQSDVVTSDGFVLEEEAAAGHRYWRVNITAVDGGTNISAAEVKFAESNGGANICRGTQVAGTASASSAFSGAFGANFAFDTSYTSSWISSGAPPGWLKWQSTGANLDVRHLFLLSQNTSGEQTRSPKDFTLEYSDDDSAWTPALTKTGETGWGLREVRKYDVPSAGAHEYWRLSITAVDGGSFMELAEMMLVDATLGIATQVEKAIVEASSQFDNTANHAQGVVDGTTGPGWTSAAGTTGTLAFDFGRNVAPVEMKWTSRNLEGNRSPKDFTIEYSDDGVSWTVAKTVTGETGWGSVEERTFQW